MNKKMTWAFGKVLHYKRKKTGKEVGENKETTKVTKEKEVEEPEQEEPEEPEDPNTKCTPSKFLDGEVYIQGNKEGLASYHFKSPLKGKGKSGSYISYKAAPGGWKLNWS